LVKGGLLSLGVERKSRTASYSTEKASSGYSVFWKNSSSSQAGRKDGMQGRLRGFKDWGRIYGQHVKKLPRVLII
jgi:hypothetical protein